MRTDDLIDTLAASLEPVKPARPNSLYLAAGAIAAVAAVATLLGVRPDLGAALVGAAAWLKAAYTLALAAAGVWLVQRLGRPGDDARGPLCAALAIIIIAVGCAAVEVSTTSAPGRLAGWLGRSWTTCGWNILLVSVIAAPPVFLSARHLAPTRPSAAGAALGLTAGAFAATAYGVLYCRESTAAFVVTWYTLGIAAAAVAGAAFGRIALRW
jgi:hypothetical protein